MEKVAGFKYSKTPYRYVMKYRNGRWEEGYLSEEENVVLNESACVFQYAQCVFEGLKAYRTKNNEIVTFRPDLNAQRFFDSSLRMCIPTLDKDVFIDACKKVIKANEEFVPPYGEGSSLYLRPFVMGTDPILGVKSASEFEFRIFACPVGGYFSNGVSKPLFIRISTLDRAAPRGTGHIKAGLNYAMSIYNITEAHELGYDENLYLDSATHTYIEETGGANIIFVTKDNKIVTPKSDTILPSITRRSLLVLAKDYLNLEVEERKISVDEISTFKECALCGTASVLSLVGKIDNHGEIIEYEVNNDSILARLKKTLLDIQFGEIEGPSGWIYKVD